MAGFAHDNPPLQHSREMMVVVYVDVSFYNSTASSWTLATPRSTWEYIYNSIPVYIVISETHPILPCITVGIYHCGSYTDIPAQMSVQSPCCIHQPDVQDSDAKAYVQLKMRNTF